MRLENQRLAFGTTHWMYYPLARAMASHSGLGVRQIELRLQEPHVASDHVQPINTQALAAEAAAAGASIAVLTPECTYYPYTLAWSDSAAQEKSRVYFELVLQAAAELGAPYVLLTSTGDVLEERPEAARIRTINMLKDLAPTAERLGVKIALRTTPDEAQAAPALQQLKAILDEVASPNVGACLDLCSMGIAAETPEVWMEALASRVFLVMLSDGRPAGHLPWGAGLLPLERYVTVLEEAGFAGLYVAAIDDFDTYPEPWSADVQNARALAPLFDGITAPEPAAC